MRFSDESFMYRILGIDNGSTYMGVVIADLNLLTNRYHVLYRDTLRGDKLARQRLGIALSRGDLWSRQVALQDRVGELLREYTPHAVAIETPFFRPGRVMPFKVLVETMVFVKQAVEDYDIETDIYSVTPGEAKKAVQPVSINGKKFTMKKEVIPQCVVDLDKVEYEEGIDKYTLTEHEYDSISVIVAHGDKIRTDTGFARF